MFNDLELNVNDLEKYVKKSALRYNEGKTRYDLVPTFAHEQLAKTLTVGADKYGDQNWRKGMSWSSVIASLERHLAAIKRGEDYDLESGLLHSAHVMCNAAFLTEYYKIHPQGDDRVQNRLVYGLINMNESNPPHLNISLLDNWRENVDKLKDVEVDAFVTTDLQLFYDLSKIRFTYLLSTENIPRNIGHRHIASLDDIL